MTFLRDLDRFVRRHAMKAVAIGGLLAVLESCGAVINLPPQFNVWF